MRLPITLPAWAFITVVSLGSLAGLLQAAHAAPLQDNAARSDHPSSDTWITTKVKAQLASTDGVKSSDIAVTTVNGEVTLTGVLDNHIAVKKAVTAATSVKGVTNVDASGLKVQQ